MEKRWIDALWKHSNNALCLIPFPSLAGTAIFWLRTVIVNQAVLLTRVHNFIQAFPGLSQWHDFERAPSYSGGTVSALPDTGVLNSLLSPNGHLILKQYSVLLHNSTNNYICQFISENKNLAFCDVVTELIGRMIYNKNNKGNKTFIEIENKFGRL